MARDNLSEELYAHVAEWATAPGYSDAERIALEFTEKFAVDHKHLDDEFFRRMHDHYSDEEILEIALSVGTWLSMGRVVQIMDVESSCALRLDMNEPAA